MQGLVVVGLYQHEGIAVCLENPQTKGRLAVAIHINQCLSYGVHFRCLFKLFEKIELLELTNFSSMSQASHYRYVG